MASEWIDQGDRCKCIRINTVIRHWKPRMHGLGAFHEIDIIVQSHV